MPKGTPGSSQGPCVIEGCTAEAVARGWCMKHYMRWRTTGTAELRPVTVTPDRDRLLPLMDEDGPVPEHAPHLGPCWVWTRGPDREGYGRKVLMADGVRRRAHVASFLTFRGPVAEGLQVCHLCDNRLCVRPSHLVARTPRWNVEDKMSKGRQTAGENVGMHKLTEAQVREIRERYAKGDITQAALAEQYPVRQDQISRIVNGRRWRHVT